MFLKEKKLKLTSKWFFFFTMIYSWFIDELGNNLIFLFKKIKIKSIVRQLKYSRKSKKLKLTLKSFIIRIMFKKKCILNSYVIIHKVIANIIIKKLKS